MRLFADRNGGSPASAGGPPSSDERLTVELGTEVLVQRGQAVVMRGRPGRRRVLVVVDDRMSAAKTARELRELADRLARAEVL